MSVHVPVLLKDAIDSLNVQVGKTYIDATLGGGGHGIEIVKAGGILLGIDTDPVAVRHAKEKLQAFDSAKWTVVHGNYRDITRISKEYGVSRVSGTLFDLGVSSMQIDTPERGFSYRFTDAPLDLRLDQSQGVTAAQLVNQYSREELYDSISMYGEEQLAGRIADALVHARTVAHIKTVGDIVSVVESVSGKKGIHAYPILSRIFQALRIAVNDELQGLKSGLLSVESLIEPGGRLVVISFHSLEDRVVKRFLKSGTWKVITKKPIVPESAETNSNRRSRSAKMRVAEKL